MKNIIKKEADSMKPIIGICANYTSDDQPGLITGLGLPQQEWQLLADDYIKAIERAGGIPIIIPITEDFDNAVRILELLDGIIFSGGSDIDPALYNELPRNGLETVEPKRDDHEIRLAQKVIFEMDIPVLGICRGIQILNIVKGGKLYQDIMNERESEMNHRLLKYPKHHPTHKVKIDKTSKLYPAFNKESITVNSFNHQAIKEVGKDFKVVMEAPDKLVEGIELSGDRFVAAVQWHPEMMIDVYPEYITLFETFINYCK